MSVPCITSHNQQCHPSHIAVSSEPCFEWVYSVHQFVCGDEDATRNIIQETCKVLPLRARVFAARAATQSLWLDDPSRIAVVTVSSIII